MHYRSKNAVFTPQHCVERNIVKLPKQNVGTILTRTLLMLEMTMNLIQRRGGEGGREGGRVGGDGREGGREGREGEEGGEGRREGRE